MSILRRLAPVAFALAATFGLAHCGDEIDDAEDPAALAPGFAEAPSDVSVNQQELRACKNGQRRCSGRNLVTCRNRTWVVVEACRTVCSAGKCQ